MIRCPLRLLPPLALYAFYDLNGGENILHLHLIGKNIYIIFVVYWQEVVNLQCEVKS